VAPTQSKPSRDKGGAHRERMRQQGLRAIQIWVPDVFREEAHRQSLAVARSRQDKKDQDFIDAISDWNSE